MTFSSPLISRAVALGLLLVLLGAVWTLGIEPLRAKHAALESSAAQSQDLLERYRRIAAERPALQDRLANVEETGTEARRFLEGVSPDLVAAELQNRVKRIIAASGATVTSLRILPPEEDRDHQRIALRVNLESRTAALQELFHGMESGAPYLFLDNVDIRTRRRGGQRRRSAEAGTLRVRFDVYGYMQGRTGT